MRAPTGVLFDKIVLNGALREISLPQAALWQHFLPEMQLENKCYRSGHGRDVELLKPQCSHPTRRNEPWPIVNGSSWKPSANIARRAASPSTSGRAAG